MTVLTGLLSKGQMPFFLVTTLTESFARLITEMVLHNLEITPNEPDEEMSESLWQTEDKLASVLYEKTLFFVGALFDPKVAKHKMIENLKWEVFKKTAQVLLLGEFDTEDIKYKMCFATLIREAEFEPDMVSKALSLYLKNNKQSLVESGLMRS